MSLLTVISTTLRVKFSLRPSSPKRKLPVNPSRSDCCWKETQGKNTVLNYIMQHSGQRVWNINLLYEQIWRFGRLVPRRRFENSWEPWMHWPAIRPCCAADKSGMYLAFSSTSGWTCRPREWRRRKPEPLVPGRKVKSGTAINHGAQTILLQNRRTKRYSMVFCNSSITCK